MPNQLIFSPRINKYPGKPGKGWRVKSIALKWSVAALQRLLVPTKPFSYTCCTNCNNWMCQRAGGWRHRDADRRRSRSADLCLCSRPLRATTPAPRRRASPVEPSPSGNLCVCRTLRNDVVFVPENNVRGRFRWLGALKTVTDCALGEVDTSVQGNQVTTPYNLDVVHRAKFWVALIKPRERRKISIDIFDCKLPEMRSDTEKCFGFRSSSSLRRFFLVTGNRRVVHVVARSL